MKTRLEVTHRVQTHAILLLTLTLTSQSQIAQNHITYQGHFLYQVWTLWDHSFVSYAVDKQTDKQTDGLERPIESAWVIKHTFCLS